MTVRMEIENLTVGKLENEENKKQKYTHQPKRKHTEQMMY